jgi:16S rRNA (cytidine1402-2'-O)-methyltransferase
MSRFYVVATPIGNLEDISLRAIRVLKGVDLILCEDTRTTRVLLDKYDIKKPTLSYHAHSRISKTDRILGLLVEGKNLALVSDAGTPGISDPGAVLVAAIRQKLPEVLITPVPGPSAVVAALSVAGVPTHEFTFLGFLPHKKGRETLFKEIAGSNRTMVFYESPHRILKTLESLIKHAPTKKVAIARELTKIYEEVVSGKPADILGYFGKNSDKIRGEFVVIVSN